LKDNIAGITKPGIAVAPWRSLAFGAVIVEFNSTRNARVKPSLLNVDSPTGLGP
jgi:hypothetical protein